MNINNIISNLEDDNKAFKQIKRLSDEPGIYALFFHGKNFPVANFQLRTNEIIYIGKTESSQISRDLNAHFASGKTGSSTLRRTFGSLLRNELHLIPIPRNDKDFLAKRFTKFKFDPVSEEVLTNWMQNNLGLSFYGYSASATDITTLESKLIHELKPILNLTKNPTNRFAGIIKGERKATALEGFKLLLSSNQVKF